MNVGETIAIAREWIELHGRHLPGCQAIHLMGSLPGLPYDAPFSAHSDVDISIVTDGETKSGEHNLETEYRGLIIECGFRSRDEYRSAETLLANPELGPHMAIDSIVYDPEGLLGAVQPIVAREYRRRRWVLARCEYEKRNALALLEQLETTETPEALWGLINALCGLLAVADLQTPTHRRCLVIARDILLRAGRPELHEALLELLGHAALSRAEVEGWLEISGTAFDRALAVKRSPSPGGFKLHAHVRPVFIGGAQELIEAGMHREAMQWIGLCYYIANAAIQKDGEAGEREYYQARNQAIFDPFLTETAVERQARVLRARRLADTLFVLADRLVAEHPLVEE